MIAREYTLAPGLPLAPLGPVQAWGRVT